jgi:hypothetical protein
MGLLSKITGQYIGIIICVIAIIVILTLIFLFKEKSTEGFFAYPVTAERIRYMENSKRRYNPLGDLSNPLKEDVIPSGPKGDPVVNSLLNTPSFEGSKHSAIGASLNYNTPLNFMSAPEKTDLLKKIMFCQSFKTWNCADLENSEFIRNCGICSSDGADHEGVPHIGGLYYGGQEKEQEIQSASKEGREPVHIPTVGFCKGKFLVTRPKCDIEKDRDECNKYINFDSIAAKEKCGQCAQNNNFLYMGYRQNKEANYALVKNTTPFKASLKVVISHPETAVVSVYRISDKKNIVGSYIPDTNIYMISFDSVSENEEFAISIRYPEYEGHNWTEDEIKEINTKSNPKRASLVRAAYGPFLGDPENDDPRAVDVSEYLKKKFQMNDCSKVSVRATNDGLGGDPNPGIYKQLRLAFSDNGTDFAYAFAGEGGQSAPVLDKGNFEALCPSGIPRTEAEKNVCETDKDGLPIDGRIYTQGNNRNYHGAGGAHCVKKLKPRPRGIAGVWESLTKVTRSVPFDICVTHINGFKLSSEGPPLLGTLKSSKLFKEVTPAKYRGLSAQLFWFWAKDRGMPNVTYNFKVPATLRDPPVAEDMERCPIGPIVVTEEGAKRMKSGVCDQPYNGQPQGPGNYNPECLKSLFIMSGCNEKGKMYPGSPDKATALSRDEKTTDNLDMGDVIAKVDNLYSIATSGQDQEGNEYEDKAIEEAAINCIGVTMGDPCDGPFKETGPHTARCLDYLFKNAGAANVKVGATYPGVASRSSGNKGSVKAPTMYCQRAGSMSPIGKNGKSNYDAVMKANSKGSVANVKEYYRQIHFNANFNKEIDAQKLGMHQCYGVGYNFKPPTCPPTAKPAKPYRYMGCWGDAGDRAISDYSGQVTNADECYNIAVKNNASVFGLQYGGQCFTGKNPPSEWQRYGKLDDAGCGPLGGGWNNQVYSIIGAKGKPEAAPPVCIAGGKYQKLGDFKLGFIDTRADYNINKPEYKADGWIFTASKDDWKRMTAGQRNETWAHIQLTKKDMNGVDVIAAVNKVANAKKIPSRQQTNGPPYINYLLKHKEKASSIKLMKCGGIEDIGNRQGAIIGQYEGNNWWTKPEYKQYVVNMEGETEGKPEMNEEYELYFAVSTDKC